MRRILFNLLGLDSYLTIVRKGYFLGFDLGLLKNKESLKWHYFVKNIIREGDVVIDIGANLGYFSTSFCRNVGQSGHVYSVEPVAPFRAQLKSQLKGFKNNTIYDFALGNENLKHIVLGVPEAFKNLGYLRHGLPSVLNGSEVKADGKYSFDSSLRKGSEVFADLQRIDYIKCDIEGYETVVFKEIKPIIQKHTPIVQVETWGEQFDVIHELFTGMGYEVFKLKSKKLVPLASVPKVAWADDDTLFVPADKKERLAAFYA
jgi:FkbM family methyltransferase